MNCEGCGCQTTFPAGSDFRRELEGLCPGCFGALKRREPSTLAEWKKLRADLAVALANVRRDILSAGPGEMVALQKKKNELVKEMENVNGFFAAAKHAGKQELEDAAAERILAKVANWSPVERLRPSEDRRDANGIQRSAESAALLCILKVLEDNANWRSPCSVAMARKRMANRAFATLWPGAASAGKCAKVPD